MVWVQSTSMVKPNKVDADISKKWVYIRKDITSTEVEIDGQEITVYNYYETKVSRDEYFLVSTCLLDTQEQTVINTEDIEDTEDALCELSEIMDDAIAALEQALCDLSEEIGEGEE